MEKRWARLKSQPSDQDHSKEEIKVRFLVGNIDCSWPVMIAQGLSHDCILGSDSTLTAKFTMTLEPM